jgi:DNA polymerase-3 subunit delta'
MIVQSQVIITGHLEEAVEELEQLKSTELFVEILSPSMVTNLHKEGEPTPYNVHRIATEKETFSVVDAKLAIEKAYMATEETMVIILVSKNFSPIVQNKLLKVIEEPPKNKEFILITESKSTLLDTIKSRLPVTVLSETKECEALALSMEQLSLETVYEFIQTHKRTDVKAMKPLIEQISKEAIISQKYNLDEKTLTLFSNAFIALDVGSPPIFVLNALLLKLLARKRR